MLIADAGLLSGLFRRAETAETRRWISRGFLGATSDPWCAREAIGAAGRRRAVSLLGDASASAANVAWVSQFPQQCELLLPPQTTLQLGDAAHDAPLTIEGVRRLELRVERTTQPDCMLTAARLHAHGRFDASSSASSATRSLSRTRRPSTAGV